MCACTCYLPVIWINYRVPSHVPQAARAREGEVNETLRYEKYVWITLGWYTEGWWRVEREQDPTLNCTDADVEQFLPNTVAILQANTADNASATTDVLLVRYLALGNILNNTISVFIIYWLTLTLTVYVDCRRIRSRIQASLRGRWFGVWTLSISCLRCYLDPGPCHGQVYLSLHMIYNSYFHSRESQLSSWNRAYLKCTSHCVEPIPNCLVATIRW